jgi:hypothetical protein
MPPQSEFARRSQPLKLSAHFVPLDPSDARDLGACRRRLMEAARVRVPYVPSSKIPRNYEGFCHVEAFTSQATAFQ